ncbi:MAG: DUF2752 domain-containing protein [Flavobacteriia bacterium]|nr:DUF2752 domain-containing protein [Flavobacteriia bacterium]
MLFIALLGGLLWLYFTPEDLHCVYAQKGLVCPTCGLTRAFRAIITFDVEATINPLHWKMVLFFIVQFFLRLIATLWSYNKQPSNRLITIDCVLSSILFVLAFYPLFPFVHG